MDHPFYTTVKTDFSAVDVLIKSSLVTRVPLVEEISTYLIEAGASAYQSSNNYRVSTHGYAAAR